MSTALATTSSAHLRAMGWELTEVTINQTTGFARVIVERRDWEKGRGVIVVLHRSSHGGHVLENRETTTLRPGMFRSHWEVNDGAVLGRRRHLGFRSGLRAVAQYIDDNRREGSAALGKSAMRAIAGAV